MKSNSEWQAWGKFDPLFGVASWVGRERHGTNPWTDEEFYKLGDDWDDFNAAWLATVGYQPGTVLEIGSGAGRITRKLAGQFANVIATDVSSDMLEYARARITASNVQWQLSNGDSIPAPDSSVDAVFSCHVFQHFPDNAAQIEIFKEILRVLKPGGTCLIHLPMHIFPDVNHSFSRIAQLGYEAFTRLSTMKAAVKRRLQRYGGKPYMHGVSYEMQRLIPDLRAIGFPDVHLACISIGGAPAPHTCAIARKPK